MPELFVEKWISYQESEGMPESPTPIFGGFFGFNAIASNGETGIKEGERWKDYINSFVDDSRPYLEALRKSVLDKKRKYTGEEHQNAKDGVPLFSDGTVCTMSWRAWGDLMAAIWSEEEGKDYCYMDFYM